jgi:hypothetical protein
MVTGPGRKWKGATRKLAMLPTTFRGDANRKMRVGRAAEAVVREGQGKKGGMGMTINGRALFGSIRTPEAKPARLLFPLI